MLFHDVRNVVFYRLFIIIFFVLSLIYEDYPYRYIVPGKVGDGGGGLMSC